MSQSNWFPEQVRLQSCFTAQEGGVEVKVAEVLPATLHLAFPDASRSPLSSSGGRAENIGINLSRSTAKYLLHQLQAALEVQKERLTEVELVEDRLEDEAWGDNAKKLGGTSHRQT